MSNIRSLIVLGSSLTALAVVRVAHRIGFSCVMLDNVAGPASLTRCAQFRLLPEMHPEAVVQAARDLGGRDETAIVADSDRWVQFVRSYRDELSQRWLVLHPQGWALEACLNKAEFLRWCAANDVPAPQVYDPDDRAQLDAAEFPLMIRPEWTRHSQPTGLPKAVEVRDATQLRHWLDRYAAVNARPNVCASLLRPGLRQFSVGAARDAQGRIETFLAEKVRPHAEQCAGGTFVTPAEHPAAEALAAETLRKLEYFGIAEVEVLYDESTAQGRVIEVNARPWLQFGLPYACGCNLLNHTLGEAAGDRRSRSLRHAWLYFSSDLYACFSRDTGLVRNHRITKLQYLRSLLAADVYAVWDWRDPNPWIPSVLETARSAFTRASKAS
jgi:predicted ATP-grasp superfamily ATP-dependent carboligase